MPNENLPNSPEKALACLPYWYERDTNGRPILPEPDPPGTARTIRVCRECHDLFSTLLYMHNAGPDGDARDVCEVCWTCGKSCKAAGRYPYRFTGAKPPDTQSVELAAEMCVLREQAAHDIRELRDQENVIAECHRLNTHIKDRLDAALKIVDAAEKCKALRDRFINGNEVPSATADYAAAEAMYKAIDAHASAARGKVKPKRVGDPCDDCGEPGWAVDMTPSGNGAFLCICCAQKRFDRTVKPALTDAVWRVYEAAKVWAQFAHCGTLVAGYNSAASLRAAVDAAMKAEGATVEAGIEIRCRVCHKRIKPDMSLLPHIMGINAAGGLWTCGECSAKGGPAAPVCADCHQPLKDEWTFDAAGVERCKPCEGKRARIASLKAEVREGDVVTARSPLPRKVSGICSTGVNVFKDACEYDEDHIPFKDITAVFKRAKE